MAILQTKSFNDLVQQVVAGIQGRAAQLVDFRIGSVLRAIAESFSSIILWLQGVTLQLLLISRAATSKGADLDTWMADYGLTRLGAQVATGLVTFARFSAAPTTAFVPVGATVRTADGAQTFEVTANPANPNFSAGLNGYTMASGIATLDVSVKAINTGLGGNVVANSITQITTALQGIDTVNNAAAFTNGLDSESDEAFRIRFRHWILGLTRGTVYGVAAALEALQVGVQYQIIENNNADGSQHMGFFYVVVDDGSGAPSQQFLSNARVAIESTRPLGIDCAVVAPTIQIVTASFVVQVAGGYDRNIVVAQVQATVANNINALGLGRGLPYHLISSWVYSVPGVNNLVQYYLSGGQNDPASIPSNPNVTLKVGSTGVVVSSI